jgi:hypothetical protein
MEDKNERMNKDQPSISNKPEMVTFLYHQKSYGM